MARRPANPSRSSKWLRPVLPDVPKRIVIEHGKDFQPTVGVLRHDRIVQEARAGAPRLPQLLQSVPDHGSCHRCQRLSPSAMANTSSRPSAFSPTASVPRPVPMGEPRRVPAAPALVGGRLPHMPQLTFGGQAKQLQSTVGIPSRRQADDGYASWRAERLPVGPGRV